MAANLFYIFCSNLLGFLQGKFSLQESLEIMISHEATGKKIKNFTSYILSELEKGSPFTTILIANPYILIKKQYQLLFYSEEKTGDYKKSLDYVCKSEKEKNETIEEVIKLSLYPLFIILLCIFGSIAFIFYSKDFPVYVQQASVFSGIAYANIFLVFFLLLFAFSFYMLHKKPIKNIFLICLDFFLAQSFDFTTALEYASYVFDDKKNIRQIVLDSLSGLSLGLELSTVFDKTGLFTKSEIKNLELYICKGNLRGGIDIVLKELERKAQKNKDIFISLVEPSLIICAGIYFLLIVIHSLLPYLTFYGGLL